MAKDIKSLIADIRTKEAEVQKITSEIAKSARADLKTKLAEVKGLFEYVPANALGKLLGRFGLTLKGATTVKSGKRRAMSAEAKAKISAAQKKRWAKQNAK